MKVLKSLKTQILSGLVLLLLAAAGAAQAAPVNMIVSMDEAVDGETGRSVDIKLNPDGMADLTFVKGGLALKYTNDRGAIETIILEADFPKGFAASEDAGQNRFNEMLVEALEQNGRQIGNVMIQRHAENGVRRQALLTLKLDDTHKLGFLKTNFGFSEVSLIVPGRPAVTLAQVIYSSIVPQIQKALAPQADSGIVENAPTSKVAAEGEGQILRISGPPRIKTCDGLFAPTL